MRTLPSIRILPRAIVLLVVASGLLDLLFSLANSRSNWPDWILVCLFSLLFSQVSQLAAWLAIGRSRLPLRILFGAVGFAVVYSFIWVEKNDSDGLVYLIIAQGFLVAFELLIFRVFGFGISLRSHGTAEANPEQRQFQFSIVQIMLVTTIIAVCTAIGVRLEIDWKTIWEGAWLAASFGGPIPLVVWSVLAEPLGKLRSIVVLALLSGVTISMWLHWPERFEDALIAIICALQYALCIAAMFVLRGAGYRFTRPRPQISTVQSIV